MSFSYALRRVGGVVVLDLSGRLVFGEGATRMLDEAVREQIDQGCQNILINLRDLSYTDTGGLGSMLRVLTAVTERGSTLRFCEAKGRVLDVLRATRLDSVLKATEDETVAIGTFSTT